MKVDEFLILRVSSKEFDSLKESKEGVVNCDSFSLAFSGVRTNSNVRIVKENTDETEAIYGYVEKIVADKGRRRVFCKIDEKNQKLY